MTTLQEPQESLWLVTPLILIAWSLNPTLLIFPLVLSQEWLDWTTTEGLPSSFWNLEESVEMLNNSPYGVTTPLPCTPISTIPPIRVKECLLKSVRNGWERSSFPASNKEEPRSSDWEVCRVLFLPVMLLWTTLKTGSTELTVDGPVCPMLVKDNMEFLKDLSSPTQLPAKTVGIKLLKVFHSLKSARRGWLKLLKNLLKKEIWLQIWWAENDIIPICYLLKQFTKFKINLIKLK